MNILILNFSHLKFDVSTPDKEPLGGTEAAVCYLARNLVAEGHEVSLLTHGTCGTVMGVKHWDIKDLLDLDLAGYDVCITVNLATPARWVKEKNPKIKSILWFHMMPDQPALALTAQSIGSVDLAVYVSDAQKQDIERYYGPAKKSVVIGCAIGPMFENLFSSAEELAAVKECRGVYMTTPFRGLTYLLDAAEKMSLPIDIYSSMRVYQMEDDPYEKIYERARANPMIKYHGWATSEDLVKGLRTAALFTYPCIFKETFCVAALEAMAAGLKVVSTDLGALPTTTMGYGDLIPVDYADSKNFVRGYTDQVKWNMARFNTRKEEWCSLMWKQVQEVNEKCTWKARMKEWAEVL